MSFIVKGIDLPKENEYWVLTIWGDGSVYGRTVETSEAEAIQIPKGHGDIKDINQITKSLPKIYLGGISHMVINDAPTILEAESNDG